MLTTHNTTNESLILYIYNESKHTYHQDTPLVVLICYILYINSLSLSVSQSWARAGTGHGLDTHWARTRTRAGLGTGTGRLGPREGHDTGRLGTSWAWARTRHGRAGHSWIVSKRHRYPLVTFYLSNISFSTLQKHRL